MKPRIVRNCTHWLCYDSAHRGLVGIGATPAQAFETYHQAMRRAAVRRQMEAMGPASIRYEDRLVTFPPPTAGDRGGVMVPDDLSAQLARAFVLGTAQAQRLGWWARLRNWVRRVKL